MVTDGIFNLLERIGNLLRGTQREAGARAGLQPVHLDALWYLTRCNRYSDTPAAVAEYLGLTKGTVSQSLLKLEREGYLRRSADHGDKRVSHLALTSSGRRLVRRLLPPAMLREALAGWPLARREELEENLAALLRDCQQANQWRSFGVCRTCRFFQHEEAGYRCGLTREPLTALDSGKICREHEAAERAS